MRTLMPFVTGLVLFSFWQERIEPTQQEGDAPPTKRNVQVIPAPARQKWALLVGSNHYYDRQLSHLSYCQDDVKALAMYLVKYAGVPENHIILLHDKQAELNKLPLRINIEQTLEDFADKPGPDDQVIVVFSLHGLYLEGTCYLCPMEAERAKPEVTLLSVPWVYKVLNDRCRAAQKIVILDACRKSLRKPTRAADDEGAMTRAFAEGIRRAPRGLWVLFSCAVEQVSYEDRGLRHGVFLNFILEGLAGRADKQGGDGDGKVNLRELFQFAKAETTLHVTGRFRGEQTPQMEGDPAGARGIVISQVGPVQVEAGTGPFSPFKVGEVERMKVARVKARTALKFSQDGERYFALDYFREASELAQKVEPQEMKDELLADIAKDQADAKEFRQAAKTCETIVDKRLKCTTICEIVKFQAQAGDVAGALDTLGLVVVFRSRRITTFWDPKAEYRDFHSTIKEALEIIRRCQDKELSKP
jgi:hypothetical protein